MAEATCADAEYSNQADTVGFGPWGPCLSARIHGHTAGLGLLRANGYVIFDSLLPDEPADRLGEELDPWFAAAPACQGDFYSCDITRFGPVLLESTSSHKLALHPLILTIMGLVLGSHCDWCQINLIRALRLPPGRRQEVPHWDEEIWFCQKYGSEYIVNVMRALSDFTSPPRTARRSSVRAATAPACRATSISRTHRLPN